MKKQTRVHPLKDYRNDKICKEFIFKQSTYEELANKYGLTKEMIRVILRKEFNKADRYKVKKIRTCKLIIAREEKKIANIINEFNPHNYWRKNYDKKERI